MTMEERINRLEEQVARYRRLLGVAGLVGFIIIASAAVAVSLRPTSVEAQAGASLQEEVRTRRLIIVDEKGTSRATMDATKGKPGLCLRDGSGRAYAELSLFKEGPGLRLYGEKGRVNAELGNSRLTLSDENGRQRAELGKGGLCLRDENGTPRATLDTMSRLFLRDENEVPRAILGISKSGSGLWLKDQNGKVIWVAP